MKKKIITFEDSQAAVTFDIGNASIDMDGQSPVNEVTVDIEKDIPLKELRIVNGVVKHGRTVLKSKKEKRN